MSDEVSRPRAVLCVSAHWYIGYTGVTAMPQPRVIHDFFGFPDELFAFDYPAPGAPVVAEMVADVAKPRWVGLDAETWGLDHGTRSVLAHMFPCGNVVHNLRRIDRHAPDGGTDWAHRSDEQARELIASSPAGVLELLAHPDVDLAVPTPDHSLPLLYLAGLADAESTTPDVIVDGYAYGSLSVTAWTLGVDCVLDAEVTGGMAPLSDPDVVPPRGQQHLTLAASTGSTRTSNATSRRTA